MSDLNRREFRRRVEAGGPLMIPYVPDALTARLCEQLGFDGGYLGGGGLGYSLAISEALLTVGELASAAAAVRRRSSLPLVVDGGVGFGDASRCSAARSPACCSSSTTFTTPTGSSSGGKATSAPPSSMCACWSATVP
ncbi:hypothetical protein NMG29_10135 [Streptomyces cocklensis]|uniref:Carboxyvinyl-carboxyphosphonate phosphorylmutase n=1 Tax=Actinacidiphila cocklensis TaxID=887465 RepID=A0A9W4DIP2_9ACTN|nr:hypothetical protein [Actinacidiphila cocklensis]MDD1058572.1 hypothetical protein [Actinacidiphila cocklensis]CAG6390743.1 hypothetical protein SCOCK_10211 [Actinacidiphila cocklensis]